MVDFVHFYTGRQIFTVSDHILMIVNWFVFFVSFVHSLSHVGCATNTCQYWQLRRWSNTLVWIWFLIINFKSARQKHWPICREEWIVPCFLHIIATPLLQCFCLSCAFWSMVAWFLGVCPAAIERVVLNVPLFGCNGMWSCCCRGDKLFDITCKLVPVNHQFLVSYHTRTGPAHKCRICSCTGFDLAREGNGSFWTRECTGRHVP